MENNNNVNVKKCANCPDNWKCLYFHPLMECRYETIIKPLIASKSIDLKKNK